MRTNHVLLLALVGLACINFMNSISAEESTFSRIVSRQAYPGEITIVTLENGLTIIVQEDHSAPVATVRCAVKNTGSVNEGKYLGAGISHVLEHVVAGGSTTKRSEAEIRRLVDTFGGMTNAYTSLDVTSYYIDCPARNAQTCIELIADSMQRAAFVPAEFDRELEVVQRELADGQENRRRVLWKLAQETIYQESPARIPIIGYLDVLRQMTREQIIDFYRTRYVPENQVFVVVGDVDTEAVLDQVSQLWSGTPRGFVDVPTLTPEPMQLVPRQAVVEMDGATTDVLAAFPTVSLYHEDLYALDLLAYILASGESSRMPRDMVLERGLVYGVDASSYTPTFERGYFAVRLVAEPQQADGALEVALEHLYRLKTEPVTQVELAKAKKQKASELVFMRQTVQDRAEGLASSFLATGTPLFDELYVEQLQKVSAEDIQRVANKYFVPERLNIVKILPKSAQDDALAEDTQAKEEAQENNSTDEVQFHRLDNGVRVLVRRIPHLPLVSAGVCAIGGNLLDDEKTAGRGNFVATMLDQGTKTRTEAEISEYFDSIGGQMGFSSGRNSLSGNMLVLKEDFEKSFEILADCWKNPTFPEKEFDVKKKQIVGAIQRRAISPQAELIELFADTLPPTTPYHLVSGGKLETVSAMTPESLRDFYFANMLDPEGLVVAIYGDIEESEALALAEREFGSLPKNPAHKAFDFSFENTLPGNLVRHKVTGKDTAMVLLAYPAPSMFDRKDRAAFRVLNAVMAGCGFPGGWLHEELRGEGLVYSVHGTTLSGPVPGYILFIAQTSPSSMDDVTQRLFNNVQKAIDGKITPEEFEVAKQKLIALYSMSSTTAGEQLTEHSLDELYGLGYRNHESTIAEYEAVTLDEVKQMAKKYFKNYVLTTTSNREKETETK
ncbi:MAG: pitrilysin family protein [Planctomycetia bacterium]|nr:pitrilysin family protein [Planctomycetia bacterium]